MEVVSHGTSFLPLLLSFLILGRVPLTHLKLEDNHSTQAGRVSLFIFGDSFLDAGNNNYINTTTLDQANFWPYGETFFHFPTGRFSDGRIPSDFIAEFAGLPLIPPYLQPGAHEWPFGANFASAGAGALVGTFQGSVIDLETQLSYFKEVEIQMRNKAGDEEETRQTLSRAVYMISIGSNDYLSLFLTNPNASTLFNSNESKLDYVGMVIGNLTTIIQGIYEKGGRKFALMNLPQLGCLPGVRILKIPGDGGCLEEASSLSSLHNQALGRALRKLEKKLKGFKYSLFDTDYFFRQMTENPSVYGFLEVKVACCGTGEFRGVFSCGGKRTVKEFELCGDPSQHLFWDSYHATEAAYNVMSDRMWSGDDAGHRFVGPCTVKQLFVEP